MIGARGRALASLCACAAVVPGVAGCSSTGAASGATGHGDPTPTATVSPGTPAAPAGSVHWLMTRRAVALVAADPAARRTFAADPIDELLKPGQQLLPGVTARPVASFSSAADLIAAVQQDDLPPATYAVLYDPEAWAFTPQTEQQHPVLAAERAAAVAHAHGLKLIVAPSLDLSTVLAPDGRGSRENRFLRLRIFRRLAAAADVVELQAQSLERAPGAYRSFVVAGAAQARAGNRRIGLRAGLSSNPPGAPVSLGELRSDIAATRSTVAGYWLNIPGRGARCPTCNPSNPGLAVALTLDP